MVDGAALVLRGVRRTYDLHTTPVRALRGVDLEVAAGEFVALVGPSGSGKSTLLAVAAGLERPDDGAVELAGHDLTGLSDDDVARVRSRAVGVVLQTPALLEALSVHENVLLAALVGGLPRKAAADRAAELLDLLGLLGRAEQSPAVLSGGERQRAALARALANRPALLLADEPTGALDSAGAADVVALLGRLHEQGQAVLLVTHDPVVAGAATRTVHLRDGRVVPAPVRVPLQPSGVGPRGLA